MAIKQLIVIGGPTAVGKTSLAIALARKLNTEIISADSRQVYKELNIGVAKPSEEELQAVKHHFISSHSIHDDYNAGSYADEASDLFQELFKKYDQLVLVGGSGLYIKAVIDGFDQLPAKNEALRKELEDLHQNFGITALQEKLRSLDPNFEVADWNNPQRLIRAIEITSSRGSQGSESSSHSKNSENSKHSNNYNTKLFFLNLARPELYNRINQRVDLMIDKGLEDEAQSLYSQKDLNALQTVGYKEFFKYFDGDWTREEAIDKIKQNSRNYAKRQLTWFRNDPRYVEIKSLEDILKLLDQ